MRRLLFVVCAVAGTASVSYGAVAFTEKPASKREGDRVIITFAVSEATDVEVTITDREGRAVRHLAAGVLGENAPEPLKAGSLAQSLVWDGKDDDGKAAEGGPFRVRVRAGLVPALDGFLLENPASTGAISSIAVGPKGSVYLFHRDAAWAHWGSQKIKILTRDGKHERAVMPFAADMAPDRLKPLKVMQTADRARWICRHPLVGSGIAIPCFLPERTVLMSLGGWAGKISRATDGGAVKAAAQGKCIRCGDHTARRLTRVLLRVVHGDRNRNRGSNDQPDQQRIAENLPKGTLTALNRAVVHHHDRIRFAALARDSIEVREELGRRSPVVEDGDEHQYPHLGVTTSGAAESP